MFIPIALADGSHTYVNLAHVAQVHRFSDRECCIVMAGRGDTVTVVGKESVAVVIQALERMSHATDPAAPERR